MNKTSGENWNVPHSVRLTADIGTISFNDGNLTGSLQKTLPEQDQMIWLTDEEPLDGFNILEGAEFHHVEEWAEGRRESVQGVFFGRLILASLLETPVAVKPYYSAVRMGVHETGLMLYLESMGVRTYQVLGASWTEQQGYTMISSFEEESRSLDNVDWSKKLNHKLTEHLTNLEAIEQIGRSLGIMAVNGVVHNDAELKNFAVNNGEVVLTDLAGAKYYEDSNDKNTQDLKKGFFNDTVTVIHSLKKHGFLPDASQAEMRSFYSSVIAPSIRSGAYIAQAGRHPKLNEEQVEETLDNIYSLFTS